MNLKPIEMQIALPRTNDAANSQNQLNQKPVYDQAHGMQAEIKQQEEDRKRAVKLDESERPAIRDDEDTSKSQERSGGKQTSQHADEKNQAPMAEHPFKGRHIDLSL